MTTANEIIAEAMGTIGMLGAGETASYEDAAICLQVLNTMIDAWNLPSLTQYTTQDGTATLTAGATSLTIGPTMNINVTRPVAIAAGSYVTANGIDYPMEGISEPEYNELGIKNLAGYVPVKFFYDVGELTGTIRYWPAPGQSVTVHHPLPTQFSAFADLTTSYNLPQGYKRAMVMCLALEIAPHFEQTPAPWVAGAASKALRLVKRANNVVPQLDAGPRAPSALEAFYSGY